MSNEITGLLRAWSSGDEAALDHLAPLIYDELHHLAKLHMQRERAGHSLQPTALVNEAYLRLVDTAGLAWTDRVHFFAVSARIMRRILIDAARSRASVKRGGQEQRVEHSSEFHLDEVADLSSQRAQEVIQVDNALQELSQLDARKARVVELRFFGGFSVEESAEILGVSPQTVMRDWKLAKAWLMRELNK